MTKEERIQELERLIQEKAAQGLGNAAGRQRTDLSILIRLWQKELERLRSEVAAKRSLGTTLGTNPPLLRK